MALVVTKFGGTSVASLEQINKIAQKLKKMKEEGNTIVVVVSAMGNTTDELIKKVKTISGNFSCREMDMLLATGEQQSAAFLALCLIKSGSEAISLNAWQAGIKSDASHGKAKIRSIDITRIKEELDQGKIVVIAGFQGISPMGDITTLGRGGPIPPPPLWQPG